MLSDDQLLRYSKQIMLGDIDVQGQEALVAGKVLIIGLGGLGSPVAMYLAAAGVGSLVLVDDDQVEISNLQRQIIHDEASIGAAKVDSAKQRLMSINSALDVTVINARLDADALHQLILKVDCVVDCTDNFKSRFDINRSAIQARVPLVSGAAIRMEGHLLTIDPRLKASPCYQCLYPDAGSDELSCANSGVLAPLVGVIGSMQAIEVIKVLTGVGETLVGRLQIFDAKSMQWRTMKLNVDPQCPVCANRQC